MGELAVVLTLGTIITAGVYTYRWLDWLLWWDHTKTVSSQFYNEYQSPSEWWKAWKEFKRW